MPSDGNDQDCEALVSAESASSSSTDSRLRLAKILLQRGKHTDAMTLLDKLLVTSPNAVELLHAKGQCYEAMKSIPAVGPHVCCSIDVEGHNHITFHHRLLQPT